LSIPPASYTCPHRYQTYWVFQTRLEIYLNIEMNLKEAVLLNIKLYNSMGSLLQESESSINSGWFSKQLTLENYSKGLYFLKINSGKGISTVKVIVE